MTRVLFWAQLKLILTWNDKMAEQKLGNPAVVGLGGFGLTTLILQFHNVGWMGVGPVIWLGLIFGGLAQMIAGLQEIKTGNNFGYCAFTAYGCFWISLALLLIGNQFNIYVSSTTDIGWFLVAWTAFTAILWVGSLRISRALGILFTLLLTGFVLLDFAHFGHPEITAVAGYELMVTAGMPRDIGIFESVEEYVCVAVKPCAAMAAVV